MVCPMYSGIIPGAQGLHEVPDIVPWLTSCKGSSLPTILLLCLCVHILITEDIKIFDPL